MTRGEMEREVTKSAMEREAMRLRDMARKLSQLPGRKGEAAHYRRMADEHERAVEAAHRADLEPPVKPTWLPGGAFCDCGEVEFMVPAVSCCRVGGIEHTPSNCKRVGPPGEFLHEVYCGNPDLKRNRA